MRSLLFAALVALAPLPVVAKVTCGGNFGAFLNGLVAEAPRHGVDAATAKRFLSGEYDEVRLAYNLFKSPLAQVPTSTKLLPVDGTILEGGEAVPSDYIYEPELSAMLEELLPREPEAFVASPALIELQTRWGLGLDQKKKERPQPATV